MPALLISAAHKSSGKTTVTLGLCAAFAQRGIAVQPFKKGPDYIDPMWLSKAAGRPCRNLDFYTMSRDEIMRTFVNYAHRADLALIEGNKGLYDGLDLDGSNSNAALARLLDTPVVLVIDAQGMTRGIAPLILGYQAFERDIRIAGVILNKLGGRRHESKLRAVIEHYTNVKVLGAILHDPALEIVERHLGLMPSNETAKADRKISLIAQRVADQVDLDILRTIAAGARSITAPVQLSLSPSLARRTVRIGIARDSAFGFYYPGDLEAFARAGAELIPINTLSDTLLPQIDGLFIGGGFPETHMAALEANRPMREAIRTAIELGLPTYAECGGLMYLAQRLTWRERSHLMVGAIPADIVMHDKPQGRGYVRLRQTALHPWPLSAPEDTEIPAHEFHYSSLHGGGAGLQFAYEVVRGSGINGRHDGIVYKNLLASYTHLRDVEANPWAERFVDFVRRRCEATHEATQLITLP